MSTLHQPAREECVIRYLLDKNAELQPDKVFLENDDGRTWTYAQLRDEVLRAASGLQALGVKQDEFVFGWMPNCPEMVITWYAVNYIGAIFVPTNISYRGKLLEHVVGLSSAKIGVVHADLLPRLRDVSLSELTDVVVLGGEPKEDPRLRFHSYDVLKREGALAPLERPIDPWDSVYIIFTSGTTGPSKAVLTSYAMIWYANPEAFAAMTEETRFLVTTPYFHGAATGFTYAMLVRGGSVALVESFKTDQFWNVIRKTEATACILLGVMLPFLLKEPPSPADTDHTLKVVNTSPWGEYCHQFARRFGVDLYTAFNMTETSTPIVSEANPKKFGVAGRKRAGYDLRIVDNHDHEMPTGEIGEMTIRSDRPWATLTDYHKNPEATANAWRNGWFHTGDAMRVDEDGDYYFVDRIKDAIRRRGENVSSFEVEAVVIEHPAVRECAAIAVPNRLAEDEIMICLSLKPGTMLDYKEFIDFLVPRMAHFMIPRYVRIMEAMPTTPSGKTQKAELRRHGITNETWDREAAGIIIKRDKIGVS